MKTLLFAPCVVAWIACAVCGYLAVWTGDGRWADSSFIAFLVASALSFIPIVGLALDD